MSLIAIDSLASVGLFPDLQTSPLNSTNASIAVSSYSQKPFKIRNATKSDIDALVDIEAKCWAPHLRQSYEVISNRVQLNPSNQWIILYNDRIGGVLYTQVIRDYNDLLGIDATNKVLFDNHDSLAVDSSFSGSCYLQLLSIATLPQFQVYQLGSFLRNHLLFRWNVMSNTKSPLDRLNINAVVAMTRCSDYANRPSDIHHLTHDEYAYGNDPAFQMLKTGNSDRFKATSDPTLQFHVSAGAHIVRVVSKYRPADIDNDGSAVLIRYDLLGESPKALNPPPRILPLTPTAYDNSDMYEQLREKLSSVISDIVAPRAAGSARDLDLLNTPFMELGLTSLDMMELHAAIKKEVDRSVDAKGTPMNSSGLSSTLVFDFPSLHHILSYICESAASCSGGTASPPAAPSVETLKSDSCECAVIGISCRFPGGSNGPLQFYSALCQGMDAIRLAPPSWQVPEVVKSLEGGMTSDGSSRLLNESSSIQQSQVLEQQLRHEQRQCDDIESMYRPSETSIEAEVIKEEACYRYGGFLDDNMAETFDPIFFHISIAEAQTMDPHQRLLLEVCSIACVFVFSLVFHCIVYA